MVIQDYIQAPWTAFCRIKLYTKRQAVRPSFLTIQFAIEIGRGSKMSKDQTQVFPKSAAPGPKVATGGGGSWLVSPSCSPFPRSKLFLFCLVLLNYMRSGSFSWCKLFLLIRSCTRTPCSNSGMVNHCCTVKKPATAAHPCPFKVTLTSHTS